MAHCVDSIRYGWNDMVRILFQPFRLYFWLKMGLLAFFINNIGNVLQQNHSMKENQDYERILESVLEIIPLILLVLFIAFIIGLIISFLYAASRFMFYDGVRKGDIKLIDSFIENLSHAISLFLWNIAISIMVFILIILILIVIIPIVLIFANVARDAGIILIVFLVFIGITLGAIALVITTIYMTLLEGYVIPHMLIKDVSIFSGWGFALQKSREDFGEFLGFAIIRTVLFIATTVLVIMVFGVFLAFFVVAGIISSAGSGLSGLIIFLLITIILLPVVYIFSVILLPIPTFFDAYTLNFIAGITGDSDYAPNRPQGPTEESFNSVPNNKEDDVFYTPSNPPSQFSQTGPMPFNDIPECPPNDSDSTTQGDSGNSFPPSDSDSGQEPNQGDQPPNKT